jgi:RecB family endonuclease NucS
MLRVNRTKKELVKLAKRSLPELGLTEPYDLQQMIRNSPEAFFEEMEEKLLLIGEEVRLVEFVEDRIDLLAVDQQGSLVIIELKRGSHKLHLLQALVLLPP